MAPYYADGNCTIYNANCDDVLPTLDRLRLFKQFIHFTPQANTILDPFMDTGDVLIAAISLRKNFVGIELDRVRCEHALNRLLELRKTRS